MVDYVTLNHNSKQVVFMSFVFLIIGMVAHIDKWVGKIHDALVASGMWNNTILVFTSGMSHR